jgi:hypothetical protein
MRVNVENFKTVLRKATLNMSIDTVQLNFTQNKIESKMITQHSDGIVLLDVPNDVIIGMTENDDFQFNFNEPNQYVMPFLNLIDEDEANLFVHENRITLTVGRQRSNLFFCAPTVVGVFSAGAPLASIDFFHEAEVDEEFVNTFKKIKKVGTRFGRVYFNVEAGILSIEATDKRNTVSNTLKFELSEIESTDLTICFDYGNFAKMMALVEGDFENFTMKLSYLEDRELGMICMQKNDDSENYFLMSKVD